MTEDRTEGRNQFVTRAVLASVRERAGKTLTATDWFVYKGETYKIEVTRLPQGAWRVAGWNVHDYRRLELTSRQTVEEGATQVWEWLEHKRAERLRHEINLYTRCDGGNIPCKADAVWAFRSNPEDRWMYACGRHLTWSLTEECNGERATFEVRRIKTEEH